MHIVASSKELKKTLDKLASAPGSKSAGDSLITIQTNMEGVLITRITPVSVMKLELECDLVEEGACTIDMGELSKFVNKVQGQVEVRQKDETLFMSCDEMRVKTPILVDSTSKVDRLTFDETVKPWKMEAGRLFDLIESTLPAMAKEEARGPLMGMCLQKADGNVWIIGVDGRRFNAIRTKSAEEKNCAIPLAAVHAMQKLLASEKREAKVQFGLDESIVLLITPSGTFRSVIYEDAPPNMEPQLTVAPDRTFSVNRNKLMDVVSAATAFGTNDRILLSYAKDNLNVSSESTTGQVFEADIALVKPATAPGFIKVNGIFFHDMLRVIKEENPELFTDKLIGIGYIKDEMKLFVVGMVKDAEKAKA